MATILDPQFTQSGNIIKVTIKEMFLGEIHLYLCLVTALMILKLKDQIRRSKRVCPLKSTVLLDVFSEIVDDSSEDHSGTAGEMNRYFHV